MPGDPPYSGPMFFRIGIRMLRETTPRLLWKFCWNFGWKGLRTIRRFIRRPQGKNFPPFLFISVTGRCNLSCLGCWITGARSPAELDTAAIRKVIDAARANGNSFFGILGGEPLLHPGILDIFAAYPDCYFQMFTNGTLLSPDIAERLRRLGNVTPLVSVEGLEKTSDERRLGKDVYASAMQAVANCRKARLITGVATSVCASNFAEVVSDTFVFDMVRRGVQYVWYYIYRPVGPKPSPDLCLSRDQIVALRRFLVDIRTRAPIIIVDAYWDHEGRALCPAAVGISHHIGPAGDMEPCPPIQFATENVLSEPDISKAFDSSGFLEGFRNLSAATTRGCVLLDCPETLREFLLKKNARDTTGRGKGLEEIASMTVQPSHHTEGDEIPERSAFYRWAKKNWFFGFGAYG